MPGGRPTVWPSTNPRGFEIDPKHRWPSSRHQVDASLRDHLAVIDGAVERLNTGTCGWAICGGLSILDNGPTAESAAELTGRRRRRPWAPLNRPASRNE
jgi:hypothetical protein